MKRKQVWILAPVGLVVLVAVLLAGSRHGGHVQFVTSKVLRGDIEDAVEATGTVDAVTTVQVGSQVSGTISQLNADFNSVVHRGDVVALIDPSLLQGQLRLAEADLASAEANVAVSQASLAKMRAGLLQAKADYDRTVVLAKEQLQTQQVMDLAQANYDGARAGVAGAEAAVTQAEAQVRQKEAAVAIARTNLEYTTIRSPIDGIVVARNVDVGQTVAASLSAPTIFSIAQDLTKMRLYAKTDESDVGRIKVSQPVTFKVDAFPREIFHGTVTQIRMDATTVQNVVTYDTVIDFDNPDRKLFPGMTAYVTIPVASVKDALKVPNTALRFQPPLPPEEVRALFAKYRLDEDQPAPRSGHAPDSTQAGGHGPRRDTAVVWKLRANNTLEPVRIALGITDHAFTEIASVLQGSLKTDDAVVTAAVASKKSAPGGQNVRG